MDEREDGIERRRHDGRVYRWSVKGAWPGHTAFVALRGGQVVVGDRYEGEAIERTYACDPAALLEGCFQELVAQQLGARVLAELLAEVRRELGAGAPPDAGAGAAASTGDQARPSAAARPEARPPAAPPVEPPAAAPSRQATAAAVSAPPRQAPPAGPAERPSAAPEGGSVAASVDVAVVGCPSVSLPLCVALRGITRAPVQELLAGLRSLPYRVAAGVPREQGEGLAARLGELGAEARLVPAGGS